MKRMSPDEIRRWHDVFKRDGELFEIRLLGDRTFSAYFKDVEEAIRAIAPFDETETYQVYFTVNEVNPACDSRRQFNRFLLVKGSATSKNDVCHRWWLPIDIDVKRPSDISSTDEEKAYAHEKAGAVYRFLRDNGFPDPVVCDSSSGYHLYYPIDLEADDSSEKLVYEVFETLGNNFTDSRVKIDRQVGDANRIMRLAGTYGRKGRDSEERPHRMARILSAPTITQRSDAAFLRAFVEKYAIVEDKPTYSPRQGAPFSGETFDLRRFIAEKGIGVRNETPWGNGGVKFVLEECPFDPSHKAPDSAIFLSANGAIGFKCFHDSCAHHDWHELRQRLDPSAYAERHEYRERQPWRMPYHAAEIEIKGESEELGRKWLTLADIADENLDDMPRVSTGFKELDANLGGGLFLSECTIISGINGSGKSSWLNTLILNAVDGGIPAALWTGELRAVRLKRWLLQAAAGRRHVVESRLSAGKYFVPKNVTEHIVRWLGERFLLYNNDYSANQAQILSDMEEPAARGVKLFILDNLFSMDLDGLDGDENARQKALILKIAAFAKRHAVHIILVAHPRKVVTFLRKEDILGTSALQNAVDNIFIVHRTGTDFAKRGSEIFEPSRISALLNYGNVVEICKNREFGAMDALIGIKYDPSSRRFYDEWSEDRRYGWEAAPAQQEMPFPQEEGGTAGDMPFGAPRDEVPF